MAGDSAGGKEVGRISIRVVPNLDKFYTELKEKLDQFEKELKLHIEVVPDMDGFRDKVDAATRDLKDAKVKVKTDFDSQGRMVHDLDSAVEKASKSSKGARIDVVPEIQQSSFQKALRDVKTQAKLANVKLDVDFQDTDAELRLAELIGKLKAEAAASDVRVKVKTDDVRRVSGERGPLRDLFGGGEDAASGAARGAGGGAGILTSQAGLIGVAVVGLLAPALALLSTALVSLPALITAVAAPIGVLALGFGGIKKALEDSGILTDTKGKKGKDKIGLGTFLKNIQDSVSNVFEKGLTPLFKQMFDAFSGSIPVLQRGLPFIAQGIVDFAAGITKSLTSVSNLQQLDRLTNSIGTMMTNLSPGITSFSNGMIRLIADVGDHLPGLGTVLSGFADRFTNWVSKVDKPQNFWGKDIPGSSTLDSAVTNLKPVLASIVNFVGQLTDAGLKLAANPDMANNIKTVVDGLTNFITAGLPKLNDVFKGIADTMHMLGIDTSPKSDKSTPAGKPGAGSASTFWGSPVSASVDKPGVDPGTKQFTSDLAGLEAEYNAGKGPFGWLHSAITSSSKWLDSNIDPKLLFDNNPKDFPNQNKNLATMGPAQQAPQPAPAPAPVLNTDGAAGAANGIAGAFKGVPAQMAPVWSAISDGAKGAFDGLVQAAQDASARVIAEIAKIPAAVTAALAGLGPAGAAAGQALGTGMAGGIAASAPSAIAAATALAQGVTAAAHVTLGIHSPSKVFQDIGQNVGEGFTNGLEGGAPGVIDAAKKLAQQVTDAVSSHNVGPQLKSQVKQQMEAIDIEQQQLKVQRDGTTDKGTKKQLLSQDHQLQAAKDQLKVSSSQLGLDNQRAPKMDKATKAQEAQLNAQQEGLRAQLATTTDKGERRKLQAQIDQIQAQKDQLKLQNMQNGAADKGGDDLQKQLGGTLSKGLDIGKNFAMANVNQFESDLGISGTGAIPTLANIGINWAQSMASNAFQSAIGGGADGGAGATHTHYHVLSVDEALTADKNVQRRQGLQYAGR